jgi:thiamine biosynthesis lipoprotein
VRYLMGSACSITAHGEPERAARAIDDAFAAIAAVEASLSTYRDDSDLARVNRLAARGPVAVPEEVALFVEESLRFARLTGGAFDPTVGPLVRAWDLRGDGRKPSADELEGALAQVGYRRIRWDPVARTVAFAAQGMWLDPGAIGKGAGLDRAVGRLRAWGISAALLDFGGQLAAIGAPPGRPGWPVAVADPGDRERSALILTLADATVATSAQSERGRMVDGEWVGHILDPRKGEPVARCGSVTVIARHATTADALATALFVMGPEEGLAFRDGGADLAVGYLLPQGGCGKAGAVDLRANRKFLDRVSARREGVELSPAAESPTGKTR